MSNFPAIGSTLGWSLGWSITAAAIIGSGGSIGWREGGAVAGITLAALGWAVGGWFTALPLRRDVPSITSRYVVLIWVGWVFAFFVSLILGYFLGQWFEQTTSAGFIGFIISAGIGGAVGAAITGIVLQRAKAVVNWNIAATLDYSLISGMAFALGFYIGLLSGYILGELVKRALEPMFGWWFGLVVGWGIGGAIGGAIAGSIGNMVPKKRLGRA